MYYVDRCTYNAWGLCVMKIPDCTRECAERPYSVDGDIQISESRLQSLSIQTKFRESSD